MTPSQRLAQLFASGARLFSGVADRLAPPATPPGFGAPTPDARLPGVSRWAGTGARGSDEVARALLTPEAYLGAVSRDAGPGPTRFSSYPATDLTPEKIAGAQQEAAAGWPLRWAEMVEQILSRDAHLSGIAQQRVDDVVKGSWRLRRAAPDPVAECLKSFCDEGLRGLDSFEDGVAWLLWGNAYSYCADEVVWRRERLSFRGPRGEKVGPIDAVVPARLVPVHPKHFRFDLRTDEPLLWLGSQQQRMPFGKFVFYRGEGQHPITERRGYMWPCAWLSMFRSIGWSGWVSYVDRFGMPTPIVEYDGTLAQYSEYKSLFDEVLNALGSGRGVVMPRNAAGVRSLEFSSGGRAGDPHSALSDACDAAQSVRVLGATLTTKIGNVGSFSASTTHAEVKYAREEADARRAWTTIRSDLLAPMVAFNARALARALELAGYPCDVADMPRRVPYGSHRVPREVDPGQRAQVVTTAINEWGLRLGTEPLYDEFDLPRAEGDDYAPGRATPVPSGGKVTGAVDAAADGAEAPKDAESLAALAGDQAAASAAAASDGGDGDPGR